MLTRCFWRVAKIIFQTDSEKLSILSIITCDSKDLMFVRSCMFL